ncbi:MAG: TetR/AcrR family transcriptional regulator [Bacillota bacterium]
MEDKKNELFRCARELFAAKGFKDSNVADIAKMAGVSVGTFYNYYSSKEKLFMEVFLQENVRLKKSMMESVDPYDDPIKLAKRMLDFNMAGIKANPILRQWYDRDVFGRIERLFREENGNRAVDFLYGDIVKLVQKWQAEGKMRSDIACDMIMALFAAIINIDVHKEEIGLEYFPRLLDYMAEFVMKGLTDCSA